MIKVTVTMEHVCTIDTIVSKDGNQWCCLAGPDIQEGIAGFGDTASEAVAAFRLNFYNERIGKVSNDRLTKGYTPSPT